MKKVKKVSLTTKLLIILETAPGPMTSVQLRSTLLSHGEDVPLSRISSALTYLRNGDYIERKERKDAKQYEARTEYCIRHRKKVPPGWGWMPHPV